jgi:hypothetical protein
MQKDKPSKKKVNPENPESEIEEPIKQEDAISSVEALMKGLEQSAILSSPIINPFKELADNQNPFLNSDFIRAKIFPELVFRLYRFAIHCKEFLWLKSGDEKELEKVKEAIYGEKDKINKLLTELTPKEAKQTLAHQFIRFCELHPEFLIGWVNIIVVKLKECRKDAKKRYPNTYSTQKVLEIFCEREIEPLYDLFCQRTPYVGIKVFWEKKEEMLKLITPTTIIDKHRNYADPYTALKTLSYFAHCSYDGLYDLYKPRKKIKTQKKPN